MVNVFRCFYICCKDTTFSWNDQISVCVNWRFSAKMRSVSLPTEIHSFRRA
nr:MAG TPA: hypothetical protein [Caudoviricetes sp.]